LAGPVVQHCPVCNAKYDVGIYVSGQKVRCRRCGNKFEVLRNDTFVGAQGAQPPPQAAPPVPAGKEPVRAGKLAPITTPDRVPLPGQRAKERAPEKDLPAGTRLDRYELISVLGKGAMGTVYRARQLSLERNVALKVMAADLVGQPEFVLRFRREAAALATLSHHNVVSIIDQGNVGPYYYFVMEYVDGPTLRRELTRKIVDLPMGFEYALQIGRGLAYAHSKGVVHRDLKPENVLIADDGLGKVAKICDFGLADILFSDRSYVNLTGSRISMGTVNYMAPEQRQDAGRVDQRADVFSYGVLVYELLTGELPIGRFPAPAERNPGVDRRLDPVVLRALDPDPRRRFPTVREMLDKLDSIRTAKVG
jgi:eukaryotic-like serine/threonine-protein kinase